MRGQDAADLPAAQYAIHRTVPMGAHLLPLAERQVIHEGTGEAMPEVEVGRAPFIHAIVQVLHVGGLAARLAALAVIADRIAPGVGPGVGKLVFQAHGEALVQRGLEAIVPLVGAGTGAGNLRNIGPQGRVAAEIWAGNHLPVDEHILQVGHGHHEMRAMLSDVPDTKCVAGRQLVLRGEIPLLHLGRPDVGVPKTNGRVVIGVGIVQSEEPLVQRGLGIGVRRCVVDRRGLRGEGRVQRQPEVGAGAFQERRDGIGATNHHLLTQHVRVIGKADARLEVLLVRVIERPAVAILAGKFQHAAEQAEVRLAVVDFHQWRVILPPQPQIQRQVVGDMPIVLEVKAPDRGALAPGSVLQTASVPVRKTEDEIGLAHLFAGGIYGVGRRETAAEIHVAAAAIVAGVKDVHLLAQNIGAHFHHVAAANYGDIVRVVVGGGGEQLLRADVGVTQEGGVGEAGDGKQSGARVLHT